MNCTEQTCSGYLIPMSGATNVCVCDMCGKLHYTEIIAKSIPEKERDKVRRNVSEVRTWNNANEGDQKAITYYLEAENGQKQKSPD